MRDLLLTNMNTYDKQVLFEHLRRTDPIFREFLSHFRDYRIIAFSKAYEGKEIKYASEHPDYGDRNFCRSTYVWFHEKFLQVWPMLLITDPKTAIEKFYDYQKNLLNDIRITSEVNDDTSEVEMFIRSVMPQYCIDVIDNTLELPEFIPYEGKKIYSFR